MALLAFALVNAEAADERSAAIAKRRRHVQLKFGNKNLLNKNRLSSIYRNQTADSAGSWDEFQPFGIDMTYRYY